MIINHDALTLLPFGVRFRIYRGRVQDPTGRWTFIDSQTKSIYHRCQRGWFTATNQGSPNTLSRYTVWKGGMGSLMKMHRSNLYSVIAKSVPTVKATQLKPGRRYVMVQGKLLYTGMVDALVDALCGRGLFTPYNIGYVTGNRIPDLLVRSDVFVAGRAGEDTVQARVVFSERSLFFCVQDLDSLDSSMVLPGEEI